MIEAKETLIGNITSNQTISGVLNTATEKVYPELENISITPTKEQQVFTHENSYGYDNVTIDPIPDEYIIPEGTLDINANGETDVTMFRMARIGVHTPPTLQDKEVNITENGTRNIAADEGYDGLGNVQVSVQVESTGGSGGSLNVFMQENEPSVKDGIWLQSNKEFELVASEPYITVDEWTYNQNRKQLPFQFRGGSCSQIGDDVYLFGGNLQPTYTYKYNLSTDIYTQLANIPSGMSSGSVTRVGDYIYVGGASNNRDFYRYNIASNTYTKLANSPYYLYGSQMVGVGNFIYTFGNVFTSSYSKKVYKYDIASNTWTSLTIESPEPYAMCYAFEYNGEIYLLSMRCWNGSSIYPSTKDYKFNPTTETFIEIGNSVSGWYHTGSYLDGDKVYLFGCDTANTYEIMYKYDLTNNTYTKLPNAPIGLCHSRSSAKKDNELVIFGGLTNTTLALSLYIPEQPDIDYGGDTVILYENLNPVDNDINTQIFSIENAINFKQTKFYFKDVAYKTSNTLDTSIPTYYGNGSEWIKFKN